MKSYFLFLITIQMMGIPAQAQKVKFEEDPTVFMSQLALLFENKNEKSTLEVLEKWNKGYNEGKITPDNIRELAPIFNLMLSKKMKAVPHFRDFMQAHLAYWEQLGSPAVYKDWIAIAYSIIDQLEINQTKDFISFVDFSKNFFSDWILFDEGGRQWKVDSTNFSLHNSSPSFYVKFDKTSLMGATKKDGISIYGTKGTYNPITHLWEGNGGKTDWLKAGDKFANLYCEINEYKIDVTQLEYKAENVLFYNNELFDVPLKGELTDRISAPVNGEYKFPQFDTYTKDLKIKRVTPNVELVGGYGQHGSKAVVTGTIDEKARIKYFSASGNVILKASSRYVAIKKNVSINSVDTEVSLFFATDSIYHPSLNLNYDVPTKLLKLVRDDKATSKINFMDSYHKMELGVDALEWNLDSTILNLKSLSQIDDKPVEFESYNYYSQRRLEKYRLASPIDAVSLLAQVLESGGGTQLLAIDFAKMINGNYNVTTILNTIFDLVKDGFIYYDTDAEMITIRGKTRDYIDAEKGNLDYDNLHFKSVTRKENIRLDLKDYDLLIKGVESFSASDSQSVRIFPYQREFRVEQNRNIRAHGDVIAGKADFIDSKFLFNYDPFIIEMDSIKGALLYVKRPTMENAGPDNNKIIPLATKIQNLKGTLYIDQADNKSGKKQYGQYPSFKSLGSSYIYYDNKNLYGGAYDRERFYFELDPFTLEGMDDIPEERMRFDGLMVYGNIFPELRMSITLQPDLSLGFAEHATQKGTPMYGGIGAYDGNITLSKIGLNGNGIIDFMASKTFSNDLVFLPDSTFGLADTFLLTKGLTKGISFPDVFHSNVKANWYPYKDSLRIADNNNGFAVFENQGNMKGNASVTSKGFFGSGILNLNEVSLVSKLYAYKEDAVKTDSAGVKIKIPGEDNKFVLVCDQVAGEFMPYKGIGHLFPAVDTALFKLPSHQYVTRADEIFWNASKKILTLSNNDAHKEFISSHPKHGRLKFTYNQGVLDLNKNTIEVSGVPAINVADVRVVPKNFQLTIQPNATIETLHDATILIDTLNEYHHINNAVVDIYTKNTFKASGDYLYKSTTLPDQVLHLDEIISVKEEIEKNKKGETRELYYTMAATEIPIENGFKLDERILFKGKASLDSKNRFLTFDGFSRVDLRTDKLNTQWFGFKDQIDPNAIKILLADAQNEEKLPLNIGVNYSNEDLQLYSVFLDSKRYNSDNSIVETSGLLNYDPKTKTYKVGPEKAVSGESLRGTVFTLFDEINRVETKGVLDFGKNYNLISLRAAGNLTNVLDSATFYLNDVMMALDFFCDKKVTEAMSLGLKSMAADNPDIKTNNEGFKSAIANIVSEKNVTETLEFIERNNYFEKPKDMNYQFVLSNMNFIWDTLDNSFRSRGKIGICNVGDSYFNRMVDGYVEFVPRMNADVLNIYFKFKDTDSTEENWFFMEVKNNTVALLTSIAPITNAVSSLPLKKRQKIVKEKDKPVQVFEYGLGTVSTKEYFVYRMEKAEAMDIAYAKAMKEGTPPPTGRPKIIRELPELQVIEPAFNPFSPENKPGFQQGSLSTPDSLSISPTNPPSSQDPAGTEAVPKVQEKPFNPFAPENQPEFLKDKPAGIPMDELPAPPEAQEKPFNPFAPENQAGFLNPPTSTEAPATESLTNPLDNAPPADPNVLPVSPP